MLPVQYVQSKINLVHGGPAGQSGSVCASSSRTSHSSLADWYDALSSEPGRLSLGLFHRAQQYKRTHFGVLIFAGELPVHLVRGESMSEGDVH